MTDRQPEPERLLTNCTYRPLHRFRNRFYRRLGFWMCLQVAMVLRSPRLELTASRCFLSHLDNPRFNPRVSRCNRECDISCATGRWLGWFWSTAPKQRSHEDDLVLTALAQGGWWILSGSWMLTCALLLPDWHAPKMHWVSGGCAQSPSPAFQIGKWTLSLAILCGAYGSLIIVGIKAADCHGW